MGAKRKPWVRSSSWIRPELRYAIYLRDGFRCLLCPESALLLSDSLTLDHVHPRWDPQRSNAPRGVLTACVPCNCSRQDADLLGFLVGRFGATAGKKRYALIQTQLALPVDRKAGATVLAITRQMRLAYQPPSDDIPF